jgi:hypothetical protein
MPRPSRPQAAPRQERGLRRIPRYREEGFGALIDARTPREAEVSIACRQVVQAAREANPGLTVAEALEICRIAYGSDSGTACNVTYDDVGGITGRSQYCRDQQ